MSNQTVDAFNEGSSPLSAQKMVHALQHESTGRLSRGFLAKTVVDRSLDLGRPSRTRLVEWIIRMEQQDADPMRFVEDLDGFQRYRNRTETAYCCFPLLDERGTPS
ncbi:hypothetical protein MMC20_007798 [Loxospora ochrophaea]|nr:hypothetical protein [Loxospora ochrophaea]